MGRKTSERTIFANNEKRMERTEWSVRLNFGKGL